MSWIVAPALEVLRTEINAKWPLRDKESDGGIGDEAHQSRNSDHNAWIWDFEWEVWVVSARDFDRDLVPAAAADFNAHHLAEALVAGRDPRIKYIISSKRIAHYLTSPWVWRPYTGSNAHKEHVHVSVREQKQFWNDTKTWYLDRIIMTKGLPEPIKPAVQRAKVGVSLLNMRSGPSTAYRIIETLHSGEILVIQSRNADWSRVSNAGKTGWVFTRYLASL
jgi:hypothetical protein